MVKLRKVIPKQIAHDALYKSANTCCVCRKSGKPIHLHHIDENPNNNDCGNIVVLCIDCHNEAHTKHEHSQNLTKKKLYLFKQRWETEVLKKSTYSMKSSSNLDQAIWTYINYEKLPSILEKAKIKLNRIMLDRLKSAGAIDEFGIPQEMDTPSTCGALVTVYDYLPWALSQLLHKMYTRALDDFIEAKNPIDIQALSGKERIRAIVKPGDLCFALRGFYFKRNIIENKIENRNVYARSRGVSIELMVNTRNMFGRSALFDSFVGHRVAAVLFFVKSIVTDNGLLVINGTPLAMGAGFLTSARTTPYNYIIGKNNKFQRGIIYAQ